jgi:hypothetical protein
VGRGDCGEVHRDDSAKETPVMQNANEISRNETSQAITRNGKPSDLASTLFDCTYFFVNLQHKWGSTYCTVRGSKDKQSNYLLYSTLSAPVNPVIRTFAMVGLTDKNVNLGGFVFSRLGEAFSQVPCCFR